MISSTKRTSRRCARPSPPSGFASSAASRSSTTSTRTSAWSARSRWPLNFAMHETATYPYFEDINWGLLRLWGDRKGLDVLDVGCGYATTSQQIHKLGNRVWGVESNDDAAHIARGRLSTVIEADLQDFSAVPATVGSRKFDVIIFADVLEHLAWPIGVLREYLKLLKDDGSGIVSLPNVGLWSVRFALMFGRFRYEDAGVLDRTHLRFFTQRSAMEMLDAAGLQP